MPCGWGRRMYSTAGTCLAGAGCTFRSGCCCCSVTCRHFLVRTIQLMCDCVFSCDCYINKTPVICCLTKSLHDGVRVQHPLLYPLHRVLTLLHRGGGRHGGVVFHQAARCPRLWRRVWRVWPQTDKTIHQSTRDSFYLSCDLIYRDRARVT